MIINTKYSRFFAKNVNRSEFTSVYHGLYSKDISKQKEAVEKVAVWKSR